MAKKIATTGIFVALALILSYVESLIPFNFGVPGIKLGLANIVIVTGLYFMQLPFVCFISVVRIIVSGLLFGNIMSLIYSFSGGVLSLLVMIIVKKSEKFSVAGVSIAGGVFHNVGQILAAMLVTNIPVIIYYLPILIGTGIVTGLIMGIIAGRVIKLISKARLNV